MRKHTFKRVILGATAMSMLFAGSAFTASNTFADGATAPKTGYGETTVAGATVNSLAYNLSAAGDTITSVDLVLNGDTTGSAVSIGFNGDATTTCGAGTYDAAATPDATTYTCDNDGTGLTQSTSGLNTTAVVVN